MIKPSALVVCGDGINCDMETIYALELAGFNSTRVHTTDLLASPHLLLECQLFVIPGGFSFGDEIASGKVLALKLKERVCDYLYEFIEKENLVIGICNGFQVLVQLGLLPISDRNTPHSVSLVKNSGGQFINRWVELSVNKELANGFFDSLDTIELPVRHGEGCLMPGLDLKPEELELIKKQTALRYVNDVNGSFDKIAALTNTKGNVLGLMPHPEAFIRMTQHPNWNRKSNFMDAVKTKASQPPKPAPPNKPHGLIFFNNAAKLLDVKSTTI